MHLLITTQAVDRNDPVLGFFHRWLEEFAGHCEGVTVICLRKGEYDLPPNVEVLSLGKEEGSSRVARLLRFYRLILARRDKYEAVFVHMNPEYVVLAGALWRLWGKRVGLWYVHKQVDLKLRVATLFAQLIFTASPESFRLRTRKLHILGHGIDTDFFKPAPESRTSAVLSAGRLSKVKRHGLLLRAAALMPYEVRVAGTGQERRRLEEEARRLGIEARVRFLGEQTQGELREEYRRAGVFAHLSETGSLDKVVLEALACGLPTISSSEAFQSMLAPHELYLPHAEPEAIAQAISRAQGKDVSALTQEVRERHSLRSLIPRILDCYGA